MGSQTTVSGGTSSSNLGYTSNTGTSGGKNFAMGSLNSSSFSWQGAAAQGYGMLMNAIPTPHSDLNSSNLDSANIRSGISLALISSGNPYAMAAGAAYGIIDKTGGFNDASEGLGGGKDTINKVGSILLPGVGYFLSSTEKYKLSDASKQMNGGYQGFLSFVDTKVTPNAGGKFLVGNSEVNNNVEKAKLQDLDILRIKNNRDDDFLSMYSMSQTLGIRNQYDLNGGYSYTSTVAAKKGIKLFNNLKWAKSLLVGGKASNLNFATFNTIKSNIKIPTLKKLPTVKIIETKDDEVTSNNDIDINIASPQQPDVNIAPAKPSSENANANNTAPDKKTKINNWLNRYSKNNEGYYSIPLLDYDQLTEEEKIALELSGVPFHVVPTLIQLPSEGVPQHKAGGTVNVIPNGALHKNKHHMEDAEGLTKKGIPVVTVENGEKIQLAEIEKEEIILNLKLTEHLESLLAEFKKTDDLSKKDELAIEAGKIITDEILHNTQDNTNLLKTC